MTLALASRPAQRDLASQVVELCREHEQRWRFAVSDPPELGPRVSAWRRFRNGRATRLLIDEIAERIDNHPRHETDVAGWRRDLRERLQRFGERRFGWPAGYRRLVFGEEFFAVSRDFMRRARRLDPDVPMADVGQALRNVWIVDSLQMLFGAPVELTPAVYAYSMLYPYTDNLLDDPELASDLKHGMNRRLERWLAGRPAAPRGRRERRIRELVGMIEAQYPRGSFEPVYQSLLAIHRAQKRSLELQGRTSPPDGEVLAVQVEKGGTSVLADGYLAFGSLTPEQESFCFGYGVFLQLLDDLQDARSDRQAGHATLFTRGARSADRALCRTWHYMRAVVADAPCAPASDLAAHRDLILRNCTFLMMGAVAEQPGLIRRRLRRSLVRGWPLGLRAMRSLRRHARTTLDVTRRRIEQREGADVWQILLRDAPPGN